MANNYTHTSLIVELPDQAAVDYALGIHASAEEARNEDAPLPADFPESLKDSVENWYFDVEDNKPPSGLYGIWIHSENSDIDSIAVFIQHLMQKFDIKDPICFEWADDCSRPLLDAYGGGAAIITVDDIKCMSTGGWISRQLHGPRTGVERIAAERDRQLENWSTDHDDTHSKAEMLEAAVAYAMEALHRIQGHTIDFVPHLWPWDHKYWKPSEDPIRTLEKVGALIVAEIDRLTRLKEKDAS